DSCWIEIVYGKGIDAAVAIDRYLLDAREIDLLQKIVCDQQARVVDRTLRQPECFAGSSALYDEFIAFVRSAFDRVISVARIPTKRIAAGAAEQSVVAAFALNQVITLSAIDVIDVRAAKQRIVS